MRKYLYLLIVLVFSLIPLVDLLHPGLPITHDGQDHVARIANFYKNLEEGVIIPRWAANLNWGYGHPILMFLYPLPSYIASFFHLIGFNLIDSTKIVFALGLVLSGVFMFMWISEALDPFLGLLSGIIYMITPYKFVELYVRGDIGENLAFAFVPLVFFFMLKVARNKHVGYKIGLSFSVAFLILSHNAISLMFMPFIFFYIWYLGKWEKIKILELLIFIFIGFGLSAFFWFPALIEGKYTLRNIVTNNGFVDKFVTLGSLIYGYWNYGGTGQFTTQIGIVNLLSFLFSPFALLFLSKTEKAKKILIVSLLVFSAISLFLMLENSSFIWERITLLQNFQFPWRFLAILVFTTTSLLVVSLSFLKEKIKICVGIVFIISILFFNKDYWHAQGYLYKSDAFFKGEYLGTTDTGESAPIWSVRFMEKKPKAHLETIDGNAKITELKRTSTNHLYKVYVFGKARLLENTLYFPGWRIMVDGKQTDIQFQDPNHRGLMTFYVEKGDHVVNIVYKDTKLRVISNSISLFSLFILFTVLMLLAVRFVNK